MDPSVEFVVVGENIHCTRVYKVGGPNVRSVNGVDMIVYGSRNEKKVLPIPPRFTERSEWKEGRVKHAAVAIWQGINGATEQERESGVAYLQHLALEQERNGASFLDLNVDELSTDIQERIEAVRWAALAIQRIGRVPLSIDSSNVRILEAGLDACDSTKGEPLVNSVSLERSELIEIAAQHGARAIATAAGEAQLPATKDERLRNIGTLVDRLRKAGFDDHRMYLDPLVFPVSVDPANGTLVLDSVAALRQEYGRRIHFAPGLSNVSFGMPKRKLLNQVFAYLCRERGADGGIVDPLQVNSVILDALDTAAPSFRTARAFLTGEDEYGTEFIAAAREGRI